MKREINKEMLQQLRRSSPTAIAFAGSLISPPKPFCLFSSSPHEHHQQKHSQNQPRADPKSLIGSPNRVQKLIASQPDPLLAKEIFDYAISLHPTFRHTPSTFLILILKLGRARHFTLVDQILSRMRSEGYPITGKLFLYLIKVYSEANFPEKVLKTFYTMLEFNIPPSTRHLNLILEALVARRGYLRQAYDLFKGCRRYGVMPDTRSYNIMMRAFCLDGDLSIAYQLFGKMLERDVFPDVESYRIMIQGFCRKGQVNGGIDLLEDMLNKGFVPDKLSYTTLLNGLCRKKKLREAYKLLCRMRIKGCEADIVHYNTMILGFCREGRAVDARKVLEDMISNGCLPNSVSYRTLVGGLCDQGMFDEGKKYLEEMISKGVLPHCSVCHCLVSGFCGVGKVEEACDVVERVMKCGEAPHLETWAILIPLVCRDDELEKALVEILKVEIDGNTRIVEAGVGLGDYLINKLKLQPNRL